MGVYLNSYYPIAHTPFGRKALNIHNIHPLEDGSIRREPDFKHPNAPISGLCRPGSMRTLGIKKGDIIIYKTNGSHILTAILKIEEEFDDHQSAFEWFIENGVPVPSNNIYADPLPLDYSHAFGYMKHVGKQKHLNDTIHKSWNEVYVHRANRKHSSYFFLTESVYNAVQRNVEEFEYILIESILREHYRKLPQTNWRPEKMDDKMGYKLIDFATAK